MSHNDQPIFPLEFYSHCLTAINSVKFSKREIDILACILSGRSAKGIAQFLSIAPKTAEAHTHNILKKLDCTSREGIISLIERSDKFSTLKKYYVSLLAQVAFERALKDISHLTMDERNDCLIVCLQAQEKINPLLQKIKSDLELAGINVSVEVKEKMGTFEFISSDSESGISTIYIVPDTREAGKKTESFQKKIADFDKIPSNAFFLSFEKAEENTNDFYKNRIINFSDNAKYYFCFFEVLKKLFPLMNFDNIIEEFSQQCKFTNESAEIKNSQGASPASVEGSDAPIKTRFSAKKAAYFVYAFFAAVSTLATWFFILKGELNPSYITAKQSEPPIRSELILPGTSTLLNRPDLIAQIEDKFKKQGAGIQSIALVGIGGSGKTTLAREYAHQQKENVVWEINAETKGSLAESFKKLAQSLSKTEEEQKLLRELQEIKNPREREERLVKFVKEHLKLQKPWFLIYDNVENFSDIQKYFPQDPNTWGEGKIILTTRNNNIQNNSQLDGMILMGELTPNQKLSLFIQIMNHAKSQNLTTNQQRETIEFLKQLPPFPLDISVAAYYLKTTNISYPQYLEYINKENENFIIVQENILKEAGEYFKTRHNIITLSLQHIMKSHKDFTDLLLFISLLDSQNIPRDLLDKYKDKSVVDNFVYHLKKYSLTTNETSLDGIGSVLSVHRSTQAISLAYLKKVLDFEKNKHFIEPLFDILENYVNAVLEIENIEKIKFLVTHCEVLLRKTNRLKSDVIGAINGNLGWSYYCLGEHVKAIKTLEISLNILKKNCPKNYNKIARTLRSLGHVYRELGDYEKAKNFLEESLKISKKIFPENDLGIALVLAHLGAVYKELGNNEKAKNFLEKSLIIYKKYFKNHHGTAWALADLGSIHKDLGNYKKAQALFEESLLIFSNTSKNCLGSAWVLIHLGDIQQELGHYKKAKILFEKSLAIYKEKAGMSNVRTFWALAHLGSLYKEFNYYKEAQSLLEKSLDIHKKNFGMDHIKVAWILFILGNINKDIGNYEKAKNFLKKSLISHKNHYGRNHVATAQLLRSIGEVYLLENNLELAREFLNDALKLLQENQHPHEYRCLEDFADLHLKKSVETANKGSIDVSQNFKVQAINDLRQALAIVKTHFPEGSPHITRIQSKIKKLEDDKTSLNFQKTTFDNLPGSSTYVKNYRVFSENRISRLWTVAPTDFYDR